MLIFFQNIGKLGYIYVEDNSMIVRIKSIFFIDIFLKTISTRSLPADTKIHTDIIE